MPNVSGCEEGPLLVARAKTILVELPPEAGEEKDKVGLLKRSLYGTRDAPSNWERAVKEALEGLGFTQGRRNPCLYFHRERSLRLNVHGDDFTVVGSYNELKWLESELGKAWTVETRGILARPGSGLPGVIHHISVLNGSHQNSSGKPPEFIWVATRIHLGSHPRIHLGSHQNSSGKPSEFI